jgi:ppGpp synthetase/RelA/SpoT-type nucleotidyltranferase
MRQRTGLPKHFLEIGRGIARRVSQKYVAQPLGLAGAYQQAIQLSEAYYADLDKFTQRIALNGDLSLKCRPNNVKSPTRILEKAFDETVPLDLLGGKIICPSLDRVYTVAQSVEKTFKIVGFKDRFAEPQSSGYRDLQFQVQIEQRHIAELKVVHVRINELDEIEHRLYEIVRTLNKKVRSSEINFAENMVREELQKTSRKLYNSTWQVILRAEVSS